MGGSARLDHAADLRSCTVFKKQRMYYKNNMWLRPKAKRQRSSFQMKRYEQLMEDLHDLAVIAERRDEKPISLEEMKRRLKKDGLLST